jgi:hypothetical protein
VVACEPRKNKPFNPKKKPRTIFPAALKNLLSALGSGYRVETPGLSSKPEK